MKTLLISLIFFSMITCKQDPSSHEEVKNVPSQEKINTTAIENEQDIVPEINPDKKEVPVFSEETLELHQEKTKAIKRKKLITKTDDKPKLKELVISKKFYKKSDFYELDYHYPYLNESLNPSYKAFNSFMNETYLDIETTENEILEDKELICDSINIKRCLDKRFMDYKIFTAKNDLVSVLLYKENFYAGTQHATYMFECLNFDLKHSEFMEYEDFFEKGSEDEMFAFINEVIKMQINSGDVYYECWELSKGDFWVYKNNFVVNEDNVEFYFDDCIICPAYTGQYSIKIPILRVLHLIRKYNDQPLLGYTNLNL